MKQYPQPACPPARYVHIGCAINRCSEKSTKRQAVVSFRMRGSLHVWSLTNRYSTSIVMYPSIKEVIQRYDYTLFLVF